MCFVRLRAVFQQFLPGPSIDIIRALLRGQTAVKSESGLLASREAIYERESVCIQEEVLLGCIMCKTYFAQCERANSERLVMRLVT